MQDVQRHSVHTLVFRSLKRSHDMFLSDQECFPYVGDDSISTKLRVKSSSDYGPLKAGSLRAHNLHAGDNAATGRCLMIKGASEVLNSAREHSSHSLYQERPDTNPLSAAGALIGSTAGHSIKALLPKKAVTTIKPVWHPPWKLYRVLSGHTGWVRCIDVEPGNEWFASGGGDRIIKIWDLASGKLKLSLTGHVSGVRAVKISRRHPYLFSAGEDKQVKCWDLENNKVIRHYHGHLSAVYDLTLHPTIDLVVTCGRDSTVRVWDMRTKANIHTLTGHTNTVACVVAQESEPQIISGSHDSTVRLWDLAAGKCRVTLTNHKKSIRALCLHPSLYMFASASPDNIKQWQCPDGVFTQNVTGHNAIINALVVNQDGVMVSGGDNGSMHFWDWKSGYCFQKLFSRPQPGSIDSEAGIFALKYDMSGLRLITAEADKTIKLYKEDEDTIQVILATFCAHHFLDGINEFVKLALRTDHEESLLTLHDYEVVALLQDLFL